MSTLRNVSPVLHYENSTSCDRPSVSRASRTTESFANLWHGNNVSLRVRKYSHDSSHVWVNREGRITF